jgi:hypothetical protein
MSCESDRAWRCNHDAHIRGIARIIDAMAGPFRSTLTNEICLPAQKFHMHATLRLSISEKQSCARSL